VNDGRCTVTEERAEDADVILTQSPETFIRTLNGMINPMIALLTRKLKIRGFRKMGTFGKLFAEPKPDTVIEPGQLAGTG
jgi:putative sterol carrier protein